MVLSYTTIQQDFHVSKINLDFDNHMEQKKKIGTYNR